MSRVIDSLERANLRKSGVPEFDAGDRVKVHFEVVEGTRRRTQVFEGVVIKRQGGSVRETFTVRKQSFGVGVERTFPLHSPKVERVEVVSRGDVRRAKLYYLRGRVGRRARVRERQFAGLERVAEAADGALDERGPQDEAAVLPGELADDAPEADAAEEAEASPDAAAVGDEPEAAPAAEAAEEEPLTEAGGETEAEPAVAASDEPDETAAEAEGETPDPDDSGARS